MKKQTGKILIIDDNEELLVALKIFLSPHFQEVRTEKNPNLINSLMRTDSWDVVLLDMNFSAGVHTGNEGIYWMRRILDLDPAATIVLITAYGDVDLAVKSLKEGAADFIQKSWDESKVLSTILAAYKLRQSKIEIKSLKNKQRHLNDKIGQVRQACLGISEAMRNIMDTIDKVASTEANILILGENGTGKEVLARELHNRSLRSKEIFVNVDLSTISETLFESEMFGHTKGAFTDAHSDRVGRFEIASGGTLFLDEIGNLPMSQQTKLLSTLQNREITRVGSDLPVAINIRLVCATNKPLLSMINENNFREDLLYRINTIQIEIPPLRERPEDIPVFADYFLKDYADKYSKGPLKITKDAYDYLTQHPWFGNIRELKHSIEKAVIMSDDKMLKADSFFTDPKSRPLTLTDDNFNLAENERILVTRALKKCKGNISLTAKRLGINRSTLYEKMKKYEI